VEAHEEQRNMVKTTMQVLKRNLRGSKSRLLTLSSEFMPLVRTR